MKTTVVITCLGLLSSFSAFSSLPKLNLSLDNLTVSGVSSGGYMAGQFHLALADKVKGVGIIAGGPFYCARGDITTALAQCVNKGSENIDLTALSQSARQWSEQGLIANFSHLKQDRVWILHGSKDEKVSAGVTDKLVAQYRQWLSDDNLVYVNDKPFAHVMPTVNKGSDCNVSEAPFIGNCNYDAAGQMLNHMMQLKGQRQAIPKGELITLDQGEIAGEHAGTLADTGYAFIPQNCKQGEQCRVHISFHGCNQYAEAVGEAFVRNNGLNEWADSNNLVVVYPQTKKSLFLPLNPQGCWDWWGYTDEHYATNKGQQIQAVSNMVYALAGQKP